MHTPANLLRFDRFELDSGRYELRRASRKVRLQPLPLDLLIFLAERQGELVTRDEIVARVWHGIPGDAEHSVNTRSGRYGRRWETMRTGRGSWRQWSGEATGSLPR